MQFSRDTRLVCVSLAGSTAFHAMLLGVVVALMAWVALRPAPTQGEQRPVVLRAVFSPANPVVPLETFEIVTEEELRVVVMPRTAEIRQQHYELIEPATSRPPVPTAPAREPVAVASRPQPRVAAPRVPRWTPTLAATMPPAAAAPARRAPAPPSMPAVRAESVGQVEEPSPTAPKLIYSPPPLYPREAEVRRQEGTVRLWLQITSEGRVASVRIASSSGHGILDAAALRAVRNWRFEPAQLDGKPVEVTRRYYVRFRL